MKKNIVKIWIPAICVIIIGLFILWKFEESKKDQAATINGSILYAEEVQKEMEALRYQVLGESPEAKNQPETVEKWKQTALENCMRRQLVFQLAKREGLMQTSDYKELLRQMEQENKNRLEADQKGEVVYGILNYTEESYFTYLLSNIKTKLIPVLMEKELKFQESDIKRYFEENKMGEQIIPGYHSIVMYTGDKESLHDIRKELKAGKSFEDIDAGKDISVTSIDVTRDSRIAQRSMVLKEAIFSLGEKETSEVFEDGEQFVLLYCSKITMESKLSYEESRQYAQQLYLEEKFEELLAQLRNSADVTINKRVLKKIVP